ncbi:hypothetical protein B0T24DRAFT_617143 [Lasiosphaeria ovina]|uniref:FAD-binding domain-containing protein n=1 Tax=Lasiosphaeria ovina TaxID=92902 RepID=A0AAE0KGJ8_9PEZI|nr:hypothetical protein B0T24DRAFT_617143 [Lasiosphaeria ovina]
MDHPPQPLSANPPPQPQPAVIIAGAGICGLLLAQYLRKSGVPFRIFDRDTDFTTRGLGWGLTLHWSLPALRALLPDDLVRRLPEAYVDRAAVASGLASAFPFYDLSTGERLSAAPFAPEAQRIRVSRNVFRRILATGIDIEWGKAVSGFEAAEGDGDGKESVTVRLEDGSWCVGRLLVACDGSQSRIRRALFPDTPTFQIPVRVIGVRIDCTPAQIEPVRKLDPFFLQGTSSKDNTYVYFSVLDAPGNNHEENIADPASGKYSCQIVASWPVRSGFLGEPLPIPFPATGAEGAKLMKRFAETWAEPLRSLVHSLPEDEAGASGTDMKSLELHDWPPPHGLRTTASVALVGDALHPMSMYRGEGANHAIVDVLELCELVIGPQIVQDSSNSSGHSDSDSDRHKRLRAALDQFEDVVAARTRPAVLASRQACIDAHNWERISDQSPLLSRRVMKIDFDEKDLYLP